MDVQFHWLRCREAQDQYQFYWRPGALIWRITGPSIIQPATTRLFGHES